MALPETWFTPRPAHLQRQLIETAQSGNRVSIDGRHLINFASNDYLGLADHPAVCAAAIEAIEEHGVGSRASRLVSGNHPFFAKLEHQLASWKGFDSALLLGSGMLANIGLIDALADRHTDIFCDRLCHASLIDGAKLSRGHMQRYRHLDMNHLEELLQASKAEKKLIVSDGVFSMDGDAAPVKELLRLAESHASLLLIDDAHGTGIFGPSGAGIISEGGISGHPRLIEVGTFGKALGSYGAFILASSRIMDGIQQRCRTLIYSTALPVSMLAAASAAIQVAQSEKKRAQLKNNIAYFLETARGQSLELLPSLSPIQPVFVGEEEAALQLSGSLQQDGFFVPAIRPPTVPKGTSRLRISLTSLHTTQQISGLIAAICQHLAR